MDPSATTSGSTPQDDDMKSTLIDPKLLIGLTEQQRREALEAAAIAKRAEERAEQRAIQRALQQKEEERKRQRQEEQEMIARQQSSASSVFTTFASNGSVSTSKKVVYVPKRQRVVAQGEEVTHSSTSASGTNGGTAKQAPSAVAASSVTLKANMKSSKPLPSSSPSSVSNPITFSDRELEYVRQTYLGKSAINSDESAMKPKNRNSGAAANKKKITFKFRWDDTEDTLVDDDPLYSSMIPANKNQQQQQQQHQHQARGATQSKRNSGRQGSSSSYTSVMTKPLEQMTARDWRILRENYEIHIRGGGGSNSKVLPPLLRNFRECRPPLHPSLLEALEYELKFREPTPIQRQAIPIGLQRRDLIGIAETGSGKTVAFGIPLCQSLLSLPPSILRSVAHQGPLALVMAPTRELALQIEVELSKLLSRQRVLTSCAIVGGQSIQHQSQQLRNGIHIIVGTPGRINEVLELSYLVLNQCSYVVLDEADRMVDMGFAPQITSILDAMGGQLKSDNEQEAFQQEQDDLKNSGTHVPQHRVTAMFSATMPLDVEVMAKKYLRHPIVISIGDQDSSKNARIVQKLVWTAPTQKEKALHQLLQDPRYVREKIIVFVNEKKHADGVGRMVERSGRECVVMHGGKSQEQREDHLERFRMGGVVMVATDVAGRGLDIPDVALVINYDLPSRSIESYTHRIGRTGRAGKQGMAISLITDDDEGIMAPLKQYLESTGNDVPDRLARHPAATSGNLSNLID